MSETSSGGSPLPATRTPRSSSPVRAPLAAALSVELHQLDLIIVRVWQVAAAVGVLGGALMAVTVSRSIGLSCAVAAGAFGVWFAGLGWRMAEGPLGERMRIVADGIEGAIPWVFAGLLVRIQGADYALASWLPPMLFCALIVGHTARLRARASVIVGVVGALALQLLYWAVAYEHLTAHARGELIFQPAMQVSRSISLVFAGALGALVANRQRRAFGRAESAVRAQDLFGKYRLVRHLASGAMGTVFEALYCPEGGFERRVAVKRIHPHLAEQPRFVDAFRREAELSARLAHPNVVQVMDFGRVEATYFLAMEYMDGSNLSALAERARQAKRAFPVPAAAYVARQLLAGLAHAHEARAGDGSLLRIVHRDLCPQNVLLSRNGEVKIADFGVARALKDAVIGETRSVAGHIAYMAPEQARGTVVDPRSDLFAVAVILWELLGGQRLFRRENEAATLNALLLAPIPIVSSARPELSASWDAFVARGLERDPDDRFASATDMATALLELPGAAAGSREAWRELVTELLALPSAPPNDERSTEVVTQP